MTEPGLVRSSLDRQALEEAVKKSPGWTEIRITEQTHSTNFDLAEAARGGAAAGTVITTEFQSAGRGRLNRSFEMPPSAGIAVSVLLRPDGVPLGRWSWLPLIAGLAVNATVADAGVVAGVKWPNDVMISGRKICGILLERVETDRGPAAVIGMGLNVSLTAGERPSRNATSLLLENAKILDRTVLLISLLGHLHRLVQRWEGDDTQFTSLRSEFSEQCVTLGQRVRVHRPDGSVTEGLAESIDEFGRLVVDSEPLSAGDIVHVRADR